MAIRPRTVFFGSPASAVPTLRALLEYGAQVLAVVTRPPRGRRRGRKEIATPVAEAAADMGLEVWTPRRVDELVDRMRRIHPEAGVIVAYGQIIPSELIEAFEFGIINLHFSLLPRWRGAAPVQRAILAGDRRTGVCTMLIDEGLDTGPLIDCISVEIAPDERAGELEARLASLGAPLLVRSLDALVEGRAELRPQPEEGATYAPALRREECFIDWTNSAGFIERLVRAAHPQPCAYTHFRGKILKVHRAHALEEGWDRLQDGDSEPRSDKGDHQPGTVLGGDGRSLIVACGEGLLEITEVQPEGRRAMGAEEFMRGARIDPGERMGEI